jgi:hypothetical protein
VCCQGNNCNKLFISEDAHLTHSLDVGMADHYERRIIPNPYLLPDDERIALQFPGMRRPLQYRPYTGAICSIAMPYTKYSQELFAETNGFANIK